jgi:RNA polymerase sigma factor (sigma-70 family)
METYTLEDSIPGIVRLRLIVQNNRFKEEIERYGLTIRELVQLTSINSNTLSKIINLHILPTEDQMIAIAVALKEPIDYLFPETLLESIRRKTFSNRTTVIDEEKVKQLTGPPLLLLTGGGIEEVEEKVDRENLAEALTKSMSSLKHRERRILELRFGLEDGISCTQEEVGQQFNITKSRVGQIEAKALRKLRHPARLRGLKSFLDDPFCEPGICTKCKRLISAKRLRERPNAHLCAKCDYKYWHPRKTKKGENLQHDYQTGSK